MHSCGSIVPNIPRARLLHWYAAPVRCRKMSMPRSGGAILIIVLSAESDRRSVKHKFSYASPKLVAGGSTLRNSAEKVYCMIFLVQAVTCKLGRPARLSFGQWTKECKCGLDCSPSGPIISRSCSTSCPPETDLRSSRTDAVPLPPLRPFAPHSNRSTFCKNVERPFRSSGHCWKAHQSLRQRTAQKSCAGVQLHLQEHPAE
jgi:hypothetical protein